MIGNGNCEEVFAYYVNFSVSDNNVRNFLSLSDQK